MSRLTIQGSIVIFVILCLGSQEVVIGYRKSTDFGEMPMSAKNFMLKPTPMDGQSLPSAMQHIEGLAEYLPAPIIVMSSSFYEGYQDSRTTIAGIRNAPEEGSPPNRGQLTKRKKSYAKPLASRWRPHTAWPADLAVHLEYTSTGRQA